MNKVLIKCNDIAMCHSINKSLHRVLLTNIPISTSIMFSSPHYKEAVEILKDCPHVSCGVYISLTSEWKNNRFHPTLSNKIVPSIVDNDNYFFPNTNLLFHNRPKIKEIEIEILSQINIAMNSGLKIDYIDTHMSIIFSDMRIINIVLKEANRLGILIARMNGEKFNDVIYKEPIENKKVKLLNEFNHLQNRNPNVFNFHIGLDSEEMQELININNINCNDMSKHRQAELNALCSEEFQSRIYEKDIQLLTYRDLLFTKKKSNEFKSNSILLSAARKLKANVLNFRR